MIDQNTELKAGGRVRISGVWHDIDYAENRIGSDTLHVQIGKYSFHVNAMLLVIEEYEPPKPKAEPFDWFKGMPYSTVIAPHLQSDLTKLHGDPTIRTYANEDAAEFGLLGTTDVLMWLDDVPARWIECEFRHLEEGDAWRLQPAAPKGVKA